MLCLKVLLLPVLKRYIFNAITIILPSKIMYIHCPKRLLFKLIYFIAVNATDIGCLTNV